MEIDFCGTDIDIDVGTQEEPSNQPLSELQLDSSTKEKL
jgi:hypothetical protein